MRLPLLPPIVLAGCAGLLSGCIWIGGGYVAAPGSPPPPQSGATCFAGNYVCPLNPTQQPGSQCSCPGLGAPSFGVAQ